MATTVLPAEMAGITRERNPSNGTSAGHTTPTVPIGSFIASATLRNGGVCTPPPYFFAPAAEGKKSSVPRGASACACFFSPPAGKPPGGGREAGRGKRGDSRGGGS